MRQMIGLKMVRFLVGIGILAIAGFFPKMETLLGQTKQFNDLQGHFLAVISDGDFFASTYADGRLPPGTDPRYRDTLTLIPLPFKEETISLEVSNSVNGPPAALSLSPDGNTALVVEYVGQRSQGAMTRNDLPPGRWLGSQ